jgi:hypothetical protein
LFFYFKKCGGKWGKSETWKNNNRENRIRRKNIELGKKIYIFAVYDCTLECVLLQHNILGEVEVSSNIVSAPRRERGWVIPCFTVI